jgi:hypothetical protein
VDDIDPINILGDSLAQSGLAQHVMPKMKSNVSVRPRARSKEELKKELQKLY